MKKIKAEACNCASCRSRIRFVRVLAIGAAIGGAIFSVGLCFMLIAVSLRAMP